MYRSTEKKEGKCSATQGLFSLPHVVTLIMGLGTTYFFYYIRSGNHRFPRISEDATPKYHMLIVNQICAQA